MPGACFRSDCVISLMSPSARYPYDFGGALGNVRWEASLRDDRPGLVDDVLRRRIEILQQRADRLPADWPDVELLGGHLGEVVRIFHGVLERLAQCGGA